MEILKNGIQIEDLEELVYNVENEDEVDAKAHIPCYILSNGM